MENIPIRQELKMISAEILNLTAKNVENAKFLYLFYSFFAYFAVILSQI
jgi:hypothetical protein